MKRSRLISDEYLQLQRRLHDRPRGYGNSGRKHAGEVIAVASALRLSSILDYGAGGGTLKRALQLAQWPGSIDEYDPAVPGIDQMPESADLITCTDVLEHIEPERVADVLVHIHSLALRAAFFVVSTVPSSKWLADRRNAHLIVQPPDWWAAQISTAGFRHQSTFVRGNEQGPSEVVLWSLRA